MTTTLASSNSSAPPLPNVGTRLPPPVPPGQAPPPGDTPPTQTPPVVSGGGIGALRHTVTSWMESHLGRAAMPVAAITGAVVLGGVGLLTPLGGVGAVVGGALGALLGAQLYLAG